MESKIEKLEYVLIEGYDALKPERKGDVDYNCLAEKINEIIDHINSQDQEEGYDTKEILLNGTKPLKVEDTPEEWEEELMEIIGEATDLDEITDFIKQLLEERETFTKGELNNLLDWIENGYVPSIEARDEIDKGIIEKVVKLLNKK